MLGGFIEIVQVSGLSFGKRMLCGKSADRLPLAIIASQVSRVPILAKYLFDLGFHLSFLFVTFRKFKWVLGALMELGAAFTEQTMSLSALTSPGDAIITL